LQAGCDRQYKLIDAYLEHVVNVEGGPTRATATEKTDKEEVVIEAGESQSAMNQARQNMKSGSDPKVTIDRTINMDDFKK